MAAYMVLIDHVKKKISFTSKDKCLLTKPNGGASLANVGSLSNLIHGYSAAANFLLCTNREGRQQGCYLHFDTNEDEWVRSGKVKGVGRNFIVRNNEHEKNAKSDVTHSEEPAFYYKYPLKTSRRESSRTTANEASFKNYGVALLRQEQEGQLV